MATRHYVTIQMEDDFRREFDQLINEGRTNASTFQNWMRYTMHYKWDKERHLWYTIMK